MSDILRANFPDVYDLRIRAENYLFDYLALQPPKFARIFQMDTSSLKEEKGSSLAGYNKMTALAENEDFPYASMVEGYDWTITNGYYGEKLAVSLLARQDDPKGILKNFNTYVTAHIDAAMETIDDDCASLLRLAFTSTTTPDSQYLCDTDHPTSPSDSTTRSNKIDNALDENGDGVRAMWEHTAENAVNMAGHSIRYGKFLLVVPPKLKNKAISCVNALYANHANIFVPNTLKALFEAEIEVVEWNKLGSNYSSGSDTAWFMISDPSSVVTSHSLKYFNRVAPTYNVDGIEPTVNQDNGAYEIPFLARWGRGAISWYHVWGSTGTAN